MRNSDSSEIIKALKKENNALKEEVRFRKQLNSYLNSTLNNINHGIFIIDLDLKIILQNVLCEKIFGYQMNETIGKKITKILPEKLNEGFYSRMRHKPSFEQPFEINGKGVTANSTQVILRLNINSVRDTENTMIGAQVICEDITQSKKIEQEHHDIKEKFETVFMSSPNSIIISSYESGKCLDINYHFMQSFGFSGQEAIGKSFEELNIWVNEDEAVHYANLLSAKNKAEDLECMLRTKSGEIRQVLISGEIIEIENEKCLISIIQDISQLKQSQLNLENERLRLQKLIETLPDLMWMKDTSGVFIICNEKFTRFSGKEKKDIIGKTDYDFIAEGHADIYKKEDQEIIRSKKPVHCIKRETFAGSRNDKLFDISKVPIFDKQNNVIGILGIARDMTELHELNENLEKKVQERTKQLEDSYHQLEKFTYSVSHDLTAPLRHIAGFAGFLIESVDSPSEETVECYEKIRSSIKKMNTMIKSLLNLARLESKELHKTEIDLNDLIKKVISEFEPDTKGKNIRWGIAELPMIYADLNLIKIVFTNILSNAIKFTSKKQNPAIEIGVALTNDGNKEIFIRDNGAGFDMKYAEDVFDVFKRLHSEEDFQGTGVGMATVKQIVNKHNGEIRVESKVNAGTTFFLTL